MLSSWLKVVFPPRLEELSRALCIVCSQSSRISPRSGRKKQEPAEEKTVKKEPAKENPVNAGDIADKIGKYKKLLDEGVLTQEEFDEVKAMLLKEI